MNLAFPSLRARGFAAAGLICLFTAGAASLFAQKDWHGRKYQPPPVTTHIVVTVLKKFNDKPMENAAVVFHGTKDGKDTGNLEVKTNYKGEATMDLIEAGSHVTVQVIADGYATDAEEFDVTPADKDVTVKLRRPEAQISDYENNYGKPAQVQPGIQEHVPGELGHTAPAATPAPAQKTSPAPDAGAGSGPQPAQPPQQ